MSDYTSDEMMTIAASRALDNGSVCFVGIGLPSTAANVARRGKSRRWSKNYETGV